MTAVEFQELEKQGKVTKIQKFSNMKLTYDLTKGKNIYAFGQWAKKDFKVGHFN